MKRLAPNILRELTIYGKQSVGHSHANIFTVQEIDLPADDLIRALLCMASKRPVCILDSCGVGHLGSRLMIAAFAPARFEQIEQNPGLVLQRLDEIAESDKLTIFTLSYEFGLIIQNVKTRHIAPDEPLAFIAQFDSFLVHDYDLGKTFIFGNGRVDEMLSEELRAPSFAPDFASAALAPDSNFSQNEYLRAIDTIKEQIRDGNTYQTNLSRRITARIPPELSPEAVFWRLRKNHPAPFSAYIKRPDSTVISASPERFFKIAGKTISASPIKGTRPRGSTAAKDEKLRSELINSKKDRAENTMIVDLLRNDLGRVCDFGSVSVGELCSIEEHPSLFHMVSTVTGKLRKQVRFSDIFKALFPCGSITGAPKISTMRIIDRIEPSPRGLSMGAIGYRMPGSGKFPETIDLSVAIRTMVVENGVANFNVGGGIVIDSNPEEEWNETVVKSTALLTALGLGPTSDRNIE